MKIINPIYDQAFKYLMENLQIAKKVLSVITEEDIIDLSVTTQETALEDPARYLKILRMDFKALIKTSNKEQKTVLIELQKCQEPTDIIRFRKYLGKSYITPIETMENKKEAFPIVAIYFLGYNIPGIDTPGINIDHQITDAVTKQTLHVKSEFIELINHKSHIIQIDRLKKKRKTRLEKLLGLFDQACKTKDKYVLEVEVDNEFLDVANYLQRPVGDDEFRRKIDMQEWVDLKFGPVEKELVEAKDKLVEKEKTIEKNKKMLKEKEKTIEEKEKTIEENKKLIEELRKKLGNQK